MRLVGTAALAALLLPLHALAQDPNGCAKFAWSLASERASFAAPNKPIVIVGGTVSSVPSLPVEVRLKAAGEATFVLPPERKPRVDSWFGGTIMVPALPRGGIWQVTLSEEAWLDIVQDGRYARSVGSTGRGDCPGVRKSVRLDLAPGPLALQLSGVATPTVVVALRPVE